MGCIHLVSYHKKHLQPAGYDRKRSWCHSPACRARQAFSDRGADCKYCSDCSWQRNLVSNDKTFQEPFKRQLMISMNMRNVTFFQAFCRYRHLLALGASGRPVSGLRTVRRPSHTYAYICIKVYYVMHAYFKLKLKLCMHYIVNLYICMHKYA